MSTVFLVSYSTLTSLLVPLFYFSFSSTYYIFLHISSHLLSPPATNSFLLPILLSFIYLHVLLSVCYNVNQIISILNSLFFSIYIFLPFNIKSLSICYSFSYNFWTLTFFISSTTLTTSLSLSLALLIFSTRSTSSSFITTFTKLQIHCFLIKVWLLLSFSVFTF